MAANWKSADKETRVYCSTVAYILRERHTELSKAGGTGHLATNNSIHAGSMKEAKQRGTEGDHMNNSKLNESGVILCRPTIDSISLEEIKEKKVELQHMIDSLEEAIETKKSALQNIRSFSVPSINQHNHHLNRVAMESSATMICGNANLDFSTTDMRRPNQLGRTHQAIQGTQMPMIEGSYGENEIEFPAIAAVDHRAMLSNMMSTNRTYAKPFSFCTEIRSLGEQRRRSAPECRQTYEHGQFNAMFAARELGDADTAVVGMGMSSEAHEKDPYF